MWDATAPLFMNRCEQTEHLFVGLTEFVESGRYRWTYESTKAVEPRSTQSHQSLKQRGQRLEFENEYQVDMATRRV